MTDRTPSFDDLAGDDLSVPERERLQSVHDLLLAAGPPPELSPSLERAPDVAPAGAIPRVRRYRYRYTAFAAAAVVAVTLFGAGYAIGHRGDRNAVQTVAMTGPGGAKASITVYAADSAGNWPMTLDVSGLEQLPDGKTYALWLTRKGKLVDQCGTFAVTGATTEVELNAPYSLRDYDGWVVVRTGETTPLLSTA
jgi:Anti-sigma-K factor rskA